MINSDGRLFVRQTRRRYDVVIVNVPDPSTSQLNRFYTREFFDEVRRILVPGGVLSFSLGTYENYLSKELARIFHEPSAARPQLFLWPRPTAQFDPQRIDNTLPVKLLGFLAREPLATARDEIHEICGLGRIEGPIALVLGRIAIPLLTLSLAVLVGMQFPLAARVDFRSPVITSGRLYTADYLGAALGALLVRPLLIPLLGIFVVCLLAASLNLVAAAVMLMRKG